jgi:hypothetical protein
MKTLDLNMTVYDATNKYPELIGIITALGFPQIRNAYLRRVIGRKFTLNEAIAELGLSRQKMINILRQRGFEVVE